MRAILPAAAIGAALGVVAMANVGAGAAPDFRWLSRLVAACLVLLTILLFAGARIGSRRFHHVRYWLSLALTISVAAFLIYSVDRATRLYTPPPRVPLEEDPMMPQ